MFMRLNMHGGTAEILWGHRKAAVLSHWRVVKRHRTAAMVGGQVSLGGEEWILTGTPARIESFYARQQPLLLAVPRKHGFFMWPIEKIEHLDTKQIRAKLGPPEN
jgi:hypothetical protein